MAVFREVPHLTVEHLTRLIGSVDWTDSRAVKDASDRLLDLEVDAGQACLV